MPAKVNKEKCIGCKTCVKECPGGAIKMVNGAAKVDPQLCLECGVCMDVCPVRAISME